uniref:Uncharacterized protein LOC111135450 n=1 Tax=Crassostrea virginica TaxID=6565 RepID=A0A8B8EMU9_CRAVI|nr:uncharacterized protein LOC111135450 [Crassostrea virginica]
MAQSQLFTPDAAGKRTPTTDRLQVQISENERISASSDEDMSEYPSPIRGNKENHTPFRGNINTPNQGNELRPQEGQYESHSDREWRNERVKERINNYRNESRKRKHETSDSESSSDSSNETETESEQSCTDSDMFNPSEVLKNKGGMVETDHNSFFGKGPRTTDTSLGARTTEASSVREGGECQKPHSRGKQKISRDEE